MKYSFSVRLELRTETTTLPMIALDPLCTLSRGAVCYSLSSSSPYDKEY